MAICSGSDTFASLTDAFASLKSLLMVAWVAPAASDGADIARSLQDRSRKVDLLLLPAGERRGYVGELAARD
jgi:hypothetical protein